MRPRLALALALALAGCHATPGPVPLTGSWPALPTLATDADDADDLYRDETAIWTRSGNVRNGYREVLRADATLAAPPWQVARVARTAALHGDDAAARDARLDAVRSADAETVLVYLAVATWDRRENNFDRGARASWTALLIASDGARLAATKIERDKRPRPVLRAEFPHLEDFAEVYTLTFPRPASLFGPSVADVRLRLIGAEGAVELTWAATPAS